MKKTERQIKHLKRCIDGLQMKKFRKTKLQTAIGEKISSLQAELESLSVLVEADQQSIDSLKKQILQLEQLDAESLPSDVQDNPHRADDPSSDERLSRKFS